METAPGSTTSPILSGIRVVDMTEALAGPFCSMYLGDLGADVIKIERRDVGDQSRAWGPPFLGHCVGSSCGESAYFLSANRNKRSLTLDITTGEGRAILRRLVDQCDVFINNLPRIASLERLGVDPNACLGRNPRLIHASITGFGRSGPRADAPGYDLLAQGMSGLMSLTGPPDGEPLRYPAPLSDMAAGIYALVGILAALYERQKTGLGQVIDVSLLESQMSWLTTLAGSYFATGQIPSRLGNVHPTITPYQPFATADGWIIIAGGTERIWERICEALAISPEVRQDPRYSTNAARNANRARVQHLLGERLAAQSSAYWLDRLGRAEVPCGPIYELDDALADKQVEARDFLVTLEHATVGAIQSLGFPPHLRPGAVSYRIAPPALGGQTREILLELGLTDEEIAELRENGTV
jgi:formyl-CoA transferase/CoA:oxalate CoA-transferase